MIDDRCFVSSHAQAQQDAGLRNVQLFRGAEDPDVVVGFFRVDDLEKARAFTQTPEASEAKNASGVIGTPEVLWLDDV